VSGVGVPNGGQHEPLGRSGGIPGPVVVTDQHRAAIPSFIDRRIERAHGLADVDLEEWEHGARACYAWARIPFPERIIRVESPLRMCRRATEIARAADALWSEGSVAEQIYWAINVFDPVLDQVGRQVEDGVMSPISARVGGAVGDALGRAIGRWLPLEAHCLGDWFHDEREGWLVCLQEVIGLELEQSYWARLDALDQANGAVGMWWPGRDYVIVCDRPDLIRLEPFEGTRGLSLRRQIHGFQLHAEDGPAVRWRDGTAMWWWHGIRVPREVVEEPDTISASAIWRERNAGVRRVMLERYGLDRFIRDAADVMDEDPWGWLWTLPAASHEPEVQQPIYGVWK
jgi:hypothetical protein